MAFKVFVDTDVVIDFLADRSPFANHSSMIFELHEERKLKIYLSALCVNNVHYISRKLIGEQQSLKMIAELIENVDVIGTTKKEILSALTAGFKDFEDAIQYSTAKTIKGVDAIITRNTKDYRKSSIAVFTPELYLATFFNAI